MAGLDDLVGEVIGPARVAAPRDRVAELAAAIGDDPDRWAGAVHPLFASTVLFAVATPFLDDPRVAPFTRSLIHSEQRYQWQRRAQPGETFEVTGRVTALRKRGSLNLVGFDLEADGESGAWVTGASQFLMSDEPAAAAPDEREPGPAERPEVDGILDAVDLPGEQEALAPVTVGASRLDLVRYAAATRDWNPIHWDHASAVAAGLPGVIVHGLLVAAWLGRVALRHAGGEVPLQSMAVRFRRPLRPATAALITGVVVDRDDSAADLDFRVDTGGETLATARVRVTP